jgi:predicted AAA+ superfamily ATPase
LVGFFLQPWTFSKKRKAVQTAKFYFFDPGVTHTIAGTVTIDRNSDLYGSSFEQFIGLELSSFLSYRRLKKPMTFWRSTHGYEVDFLIGDHTAIEVKATQRISSHHLKGLKALQEEEVFKNLYLVSHDRIDGKKEGITFMHWETFLKKLWSGEVIN